MPRSKRSRSASARRGWETRRRNELERAREAAKEAKRRSEAAQRGWKKRRERAEREELRQTSTEVLRRTLERLQVARLFNETGSAVDIEPGPGMVTHPNGRRPSAHWHDGRAYRAWRKAKRHVRRALGQEEFAAILRTIAEGMVDMTPALLVSYVNS